MVRPFFLADPYIIGELKRVIEMKGIDGDVAGVGGYEAGDGLAVKSTPAGIKILFTARAVITWRPPRFIRPY